MPTFGLSASVLPLIPTALPGADDSADFTRIGNPPFTVRWGNRSVTIGNHINFVQVPTLMAVSNDRNEAAWDGRGVDVFNFSNSYSLSSKNVTFGVTSVIDDQSFC
jgi:hypothetical protein